MYFMKEVCYETCPEIERVQEWIYVDGQYTDHIARRIEEDDREYLRQFKESCAECPGPKEVSYETQLRWSGLRRLFRRPDTITSQYFICPIVEQRRNKSDSQAVSPLTEN
jgi:hypothetical protein